jgi:hypothetical protein
MKDKIPETLEEAVDLIIRKNLSQLDNLQKEDMSKYHFSVGMNIRNAWGLWDKNSILHKHFSERFGLWHADDMSGLIFHCFKKAINSQPWEADKKAEYYHEYWKNMKVTHK